MVHCYKIISQVYPHVANVLLTSCVQVVDNKNQDCSKTVSLFKFQQNYFSFLESTSYVWATAFGRDVGDSKKPLTLTARYLSSWLAFLALIFINVYVARLMAELVKEEPIKPFTSLKDSKVMYKRL